MEGNPHKIELRDLYAQYITIKLRYKRTKNRWALESSEIPAGIEEIIGYQIPKEFSGGSVRLRTCGIPRLWKPTSAFAVPFQRIKRLLKVGTWRKYGWKWSRRSSKVIMP